MFYPKDANGTKLADGDKVMHEDDKRAIWSVVYDKNRFAWGIKNNWSAFLGFSITNSPSNFIKL